MPIAWFISGYTVAEGKPGIHNVRFCSMMNFNTQILADGGAWAESEIVNDSAVVKVRASAITIGAIRNTQGFYWIPLDITDINALMTALTQPQYNAIRNELLSLSYLDSEINTVLGSTRAQWQTKTFKQLLDFAATRRFKPRYDAATDSIIFDGPIVIPRSIASVDAEVLSEQQLLEKAELAEIAEHAAKVGMNPVETAMVQADYLTYKRKHKRSAGEK